MTTKKSAQTTAQKTLDGGEIDIKNVACTKYPGCNHEAEYVVEVLSYEVGEEIEVECCQRCRDEFAEWVDAGKIRELSRSEKYHGET